jgi:predicted phosphatase
MGFGETLWDTENVSSLIPAFKLLKSLDFWEQTEMSGNKSLVELSGIEPLTSSLRTTRSPN